MLGTAGFLRRLVWCFHVSGRAFNDPVLGLSEHFHQNVRFQKLCRAVYFYGLVIAACLWLQVPVLSLMAGIALQKAALVIYPLLGKEDVDGPRCNKRH